MNKKVVNAMSSMLCATMLMGSVVPVFAATTDTQTTSKETDSKDVVVTYDKSASYFVTIPKTIVLDSNKESTYNVKVEGDIPSNKNVYVAPVDAISETDEIDFYMHDQSTKNTKADVVATVTHNKDIWDFEDAASGYEETNNTISASNLTAGNWKGTFTFNINLRDVTNGGGTIDEDTYGEDVTLTSSNLATYGIANTGDVTIPSIVTDSEGVKHKVTSIGNAAFSACTKLTTITISDSVTSIGSAAFRACSNLTTITIPDSVTSIGGYAFNNCPKLTTITIPANVTRIEDDTFWQCTGLTSITMPDSVASIGDSAFRNCSSLTSIIIPNNATSIENYAFWGCTEVTAITYKGIKYTNETKLTNALTSNGVSVGSYAFTNTKLQ